MLVIIIIVGITLLLYYNLNLIRNQFHKYIVRKYLFHPDHKVKWTPKYNFFNKSLIHIDDNSFITLWQFFPKVYNDKNIIIIYPGNIENMSYYNDLIDYGLTIKLNVVTFDYRGFGLSKGDASKKNILEDGVLVYKYVRSLYPEKKIILWGDSLGCSVASYTAKEVGKINIIPPYKLLLMGSFSSVSDVLYEKKGYILWLSSIILFKLFRCDLHVRKWLEKVNYNLEVIFLHSYKDIDIIIDNCFRNINNNNKLIKSKFIKIEGTHYTPQLNPITKRLEELLI